MKEINKDEKFSPPQLPENDSGFIPPPMPENSKIFNKKIYVISVLVLATVVIGIVAITTISKNKSETTGSNYYSESSNTLKDGEVGIRDQYGNEYGVQIDEDYYASLDDGVNSSNNNTTSKGTSESRSSQITASSSKAPDYGYEENSNYSSSYESSVSSSNNAYTVSNTPEKNEYKVGNKITFGKQHEWLVLDVHDGKALILSLSGDYENYYCYTHRESGNTWENSDLRKYLNETYYNYYFTITERNRILTTDLINESNPDWGTEGGNNTQDKIFILSASEILKYSDTIIKFQTDNINYLPGGRFRGWLRTPGRYFCYTSFYRLTQENDSFCISIDYEGIDFGSSEYYYPAMWIRTDE